MNKADLPPLALIAGPTASGKSALALDLAERLGGVIVNADSMQVYRDLRTLTARPSSGDEARADHRLFGHIDAATAYSAAEWADAARRELENVWDQDRLPILVGGTGLYLRTLLEGIAPVPAIDPEIRAAVRALPVAEAQAALRREDPDAGARLSPRDSARIARALEVIRSTGRPLAAWQAERFGGIDGKIRLQPLVLDPPPATLNERIDRRAAAMLPGALREVEALAARQLDPTLPAMRALGVPALLAHLRGQFSAVVALERLQTETRGYAKRQRTWFRRQIPTTWARARTIDEASSILWTAAV